MNQTRKKICKSGNACYFRTMELCVTCQKSLQCYFITVSLIKQINLFQMSTSAQCQTRGWKVESAIRQHHVSLAQCQTSAKSE